MRSAHQDPSTSPGAFLRARSRPGKLYLASPYVVAASVIAGKIVEPFDFLREREAELVEV